MKRLLSIILLLTCALLPACTGATETDTTADSSDTTTESSTGDNSESSTEDNSEKETADPSPTKYFVRTPKQPPEKKLERKVYTFDTYEDALAYATKYEVAVLGYAVYDQDGKFLGGLYSELVTNLLYNAKHVTDYVRINGYKYGNASVNPAITYKRRLYGVDNGEKIVSCDRLVDWILYDTGFIDQPNEMGMHINAYMDPTYGMMGWCIAHDFIKIEREEDLQAGDLVFTGRSKPNDPNFAAHVYLFAGRCSDDDNRLYYRYDGGADDRLMCNGRFLAYNRVGQPFKEPIGEFVVGYRPVESALNKISGRK